MYDTNKIILTGQITQIESFKTKTGKLALNLYVKSSNKYEDVNPCVAYGEMANSIHSHFKVGANVIIIGRSMSLMFKDIRSVTTRVVIEKIGEELIVKQNEDGQEK